ncbi:phosphotransferase [Yinghuangia soli]|uniref:phosphotransferase n=1 Tax=Yinghuangia soli TaxID=2908204 RepID=UPI0027E31848|nr:phosphotransferase [Yinghuangia soli]
MYRLVLEDASTAVAYVWNDAENYWPTTPGTDSDDHRDPFSAATGIDLFEAAHRHLTALGIRTPRIHLADRSRTYLPADVVVLEDVTGGSLEALLRADPAAAARPLARLAEALGAMHGHRGPRFGKVALIDAGRASHGESCEQVLLERALTDLAEAASRDTRLRGRDRDLEAAVRGLAATVQPRTEYALIHGELGPDHVLVDAAGEPVIIDIEGLMFFDVEWEHTFLHLRFGEHYPAIAAASAADLDPQRIAFYAMAMHLSLIAGPLRLLDGDFPDRDAMLGIVEHNLAAALAFLPRAAA